MEFIDSVTPSYQQYHESLVQDVTGNKKYNYSDKAWQARNDWATMYYQNAYNQALLNYQNEYNTPLNQMLRYQEAGINPFLAAQDAGNMGSYPSGASPTGRFSAPSTPQTIQAISSAVNQSIGSLNNTLKTAQGLYEYITYGRPLQQINLGTAGIQQNIAGLNEQIAAYNVDAARSNALMKDAEASWSEYWNLGREYPGEDVAHSPRGIYMEQSTQRITAQIEQLKSLVDVLYPSQSDANEARAALTEYQKQVLQGQNDAILHLDTGNTERDAIIKQVLFWISNRLQVRI